VRYQNPIICLA